jgi:alanyl-tRNA synthetase
VVIARSPDVGLDCRPLIKEAMTMVSGSGGGKQDFAQGGGTDASKLESALDRVLELTKETLERSEH